MELVEQHSISGVTDSSGPGIEGTADSRTDRGTWFFGDSDSDADAAPVSCDHFRCDMRARHEFDLGHHDVELGRTGIETRRFRCRESHIGHTQMQPGEQDERLDCLHCR